MAKGAYIGVDNIARKIKKGYIGVDGVARKIKKAYIGIGGVARPCWSGGELAYYGTITQLYQKRHSMVGASVGNYALFAGGTTASKVNRVEAYDNTLAQVSSVTSLSEARMNAKATSVGGYALIAGGYNKSGIGTPTVDAYNTSLTRSVPTNLSYYFRDHSATTVGDYALFGQGNDSNSTGASKKVTAYNSALTRSFPADLQENRQNGAATTVGGYALFAGGTGDVSGSSTKYYASVDAYDESLVKTIPTSMQNNRNAHAGVTVGNYALFGGGRVTTSSVKTVEVYDSNLTRLTAPDLLQTSNYSHSLTANAIGDFALFTGGPAMSTGSKYAVVTVYDASLTVTTAESRSVSSGGVAGATVGDYLLFAGGYSDSGYVGNVDVYTVV